MVVSHIINFLTAVAVLGSLLSVVLIVRSEWHSNISFSVQATYWIYIYKIEYLPAKTNVQRPNNWWMFVDR